MKIKIFIFLLFLIFGLTKSNAMHLTSHFTLISWSADGDYALIKETVYGPEGGGKIIFHITGGNNFIHEKYILSDDLSPGDGTTPERINEIQYNLELIKITKSLKDKNFKDMTVKSMNNKNRSLSLSSNIKNNEFKIMTEDKSQTAWRHENLIINKNLKNLEIISAGTFLHTVKDASFDENFALTAYISPKNFMIILIVNIEDYNMEKLIGAVYSKNGKWNNAVFYEIINN